MRWRHFLIRLRRRLQSRIVPSRWTCSEPACWPSASRRSTSTTTSPPVSRADRPGLCDELLARSAQRRGRVSARQRRSTKASSRGLAHAGLITAGCEDLSASSGVGLQVRRRPRRADRHHHRGRPTRVRHLRGAGRIRAGADPRTHAGWAQGCAGRAAARAAGSSRCRKPRCGWPRLRWPTVTHLCPNSAGSSVSGR